MKILQVNCVYRTGSTGKIVAEMHTKLQECGLESVVCYGRGRLVKEENVYKICGEFYSKVNHFLAQVTGQLYGGCRVSTAKLLSVIKKENPDVVHLQCINGFFVNIPYLINWLKKRRIRTVLTLHAEFMYTANCGHARECERWKSGCGKCPQLKTDIKSFGIDGTHRSWKKMERAFKGFREKLAVVSVSPWLMERALQSPFLSDKEHYVVMNGLDTDVFYPRQTDALRQSYQYGKKKKIVLFVTTFLTDGINDLKGGRYVIELARELEHEDIVVLVAGRYDTSLNLPSNMVTLGRLEDQNTLAQYYSMADVTVLTSKRETFSMVTAESLCCGTPVVGFEAGGPETIALPEFSEFVPQGDVTALKTALLKMLKREIECGKLGKVAEAHYSSKRMLESYIGIYKRLVDSNN